MAKAIWQARPGGVVKAETPEALAREGVTVYPFSLCSLWGEEAPSRYMRAQGMDEKAIREVTEHHRGQRQRRSEEE